jgi:putative membrane protein
MKRSQYSQYSAASLILRDHLALERTTMANERTLLAYVRTMVGIIAVGGSILKLFTGWLFTVSGWSLILFGLAVLIVGFVRYTRIQTLLQEVVHSDQRDQDWMHQLLGTVLEKLHLVKIKN